MLGRILVVEDEEAIAVCVQTVLEQDGFQVKWAANGSRALALVDSFEPDMVIVDLGLPDLDGLQLSQAIRRRDHYLPLIMLTARADTIDKIVGLEAGADDYITKPFNPREVLARVRAILRLARHSAGAPAKNRLVYGPLEIDLQSRQVLKAGHPVDLTPKEFDLLAWLARSPGRIFGRDTLLEQLWGYDFAGDSRTVDVHIQRLRRKLEDNPHQPQFLLTVHTIGYKFTAQP